jgi:spore germination cell wall hydrolase CwlJ-like protein
LNNHLSPADRGLFFAWRKVMTEAEKDRDILARTLWSEARGELLAGQIAVAWTIRNRVNDGKVKS